MEGKSVGPQVSLPPGISISRSPTKDTKEDEVGEPEKKTNEILRPAAKILRMMKLVPPNSRTIGFRTMLLKRI